MKMRKIMCGILIFLAGGGLFFCVLGGCGERWLPNQSGTRAFRFIGRQEGLVGLLVKSMKTGNVIGVIDTGASKYHRYSARWIADNCILFRSSDIGHRAIVVNEKCQLYFARVENKAGVLRVVLYDEEWGSVGIEFECMAVESDTN